MKLKDSTLLFFIGILAVILRFSGIYFGLPDIIDIRPDETRMVQAFLDLIKTKGLDPGHYAYGGLFHFTMAFSQIIHIVLQLITHRISFSQESFQNYLFLNMENFVITERVTIAIFSAITPLVFFFITLKLTTNRVTSFLGSIVVAINFLLVRDGHFGSSADTLATFWLALAFLAWANDRELKHPFYFILFSGLAAASKYHYGIIVTTPFLFGVDRKRTWKFPFFSLIVFFLLNPAFFVQLSRVFQDTSRGLAQQLEILASAPYSKILHPDEGRLHGFKYLVTFVLKHSMGTLWLLFMFSCFAIIIFKRTFQEIKILMGMLFVWVSIFVLNGTSGMSFMRYSIPLVFLGYLICFCFFSGRLAIPMFVFAIFPSVFDTPKMLELLLKEDTRTLAKQWAQKNIQESHSVLLVGHYASPSLKQAKELLQAQLDQEISLGNVNRKLTTIITQYSSYKAEEKSYRLFQAGYGKAPSYLGDPTPAELIARQIDWVIWGDSWDMYCNNLCPNNYPNLKTELEKNFERVVTFNPLNDGTKIPIIDVLDGLYLPSGKPWDWKNMGPVISIYRRK